MWAWVCQIYWFFFFSSRRRHTRLQGDWSSDVCSSDLTITDGNDWSNVAGGFLSGDTVYFADAASGNLMSMPFVNGQPTGTASVADSTLNWAAAGDVVINSSQVPTNTPPAADFAVGCPT